MCHLAVSRRPNKGLRSTRIWQPSGAPLNQQRHPSEQNVQIATRAAIRRAHGRSFKSQLAAEVSHEAKNEWACQMIHAHWREEVERPVLTDRIAAYTSYNTADKFPSGAPLLTIRSHL